MWLDVHVQKRCVTSLGQFARQISDNKQNKLVQYIRKYVCTYTGKQIKHTLGVAIKFSRHKSEQIVIFCLSKCGNRDYIKFAIVYYTHLDGDVIRTISHHACGSKLFSFLKASGDIEELSDHILTVID